MRITALSAALAMVLLTLSSALQAQRPDDDIDPKSLSLLQQGRSAQAAGNLDGATDLIETALVVDPRNRDAFIALAEISRTRGLPGKAIGFYREALLLEPNDVAVLRGQGEAMIAKGAVEKAKEVLARIKTICVKECGDATQLAAVIAKGPPLTTAQATVPPSATKAP